MEIQHREIYREIDQGTLFKESQAKPRSVEKEGNDEKFSQCM